MNLCLFWLSKVYNQKHFNRISKTFIKNRGFISNSMNTQKLLTDKDMTMYIYLIIQSRLSKTKEPTVLFNLKISYRFP